MHINFRIELDMITSPSLPSIPIDKPLGNKPLNKHPSNNETKSDNIDELYTHIEGNLDFITDNGITKGITPQIIQTKGENNV